MEVLFTRFTEFLVGLKNSKCRISVIKSLKIVYASGFTKKGKKSGNIYQFPKD